MHKSTVLIIEDNEINREILEAILEDDYNLLIAENGKQGMELLSAHTADIDVVLLDIQMPVMNGYEVLEAVSNDLNLRHIPIIVTTGDDGLDVEEHCLTLHATDFIKKPYNPLIVRYAAACQGDPCSRSANSVHKSSLLHAVPPTRC